MNLTDTHTFRPTAHASACGGVPRSSLGLHYPSVEDLARSRWCSRSQIVWWREVARRRLSRVEPSTAAPGARDRDACKTGPPGAGVLHAPATGNSVGCGVEGHTARMTRRRCETGVRQGAVGAGVDADERTRRCSWHHPRVASARTPDLRWIFRPLSFLHAEEVRRCVL